MKGIRRHGNQRAATSSLVNMATSLPMSVEVLSLDREHCFRHESEIKKQKKGGYVIGQIRLVNAPKRFCMEITLAPSDENSSVSAVPNLLHLTWKTGRRAQG